MDQARKLNIFEVLESINQKDVGLYKSWTEEEAKQFVPLVTMRWMTGTDDARQIVLLNEFANPYVFSLYKHKELLTNLFVACSSGNSQRYTWMKGSSKATTGMPNIVSVVREYFGYSTKEAVQSIPLLKDEDILSYAEQLARQSDEISKIKKELKAR
jgi:hypothetical protein